MEVNLFSMKDIPPLLGSEISNRSNHDITIIKVVVYKCDDIILDRDEFIDFEVPSDYFSNGGLALKTDNFELFSRVGCKVDHEGYFTIPWLRSDVKESLYVWFYVIRDLLKHSNSSPWESNFLIKRNFNNLAKIISSSNPQKVTAFASVGSNKGRRGYMEDVHCVFDNINISTRHSVALYGVFDGHGGKECAVSAADDIPTKFATFMRSQARGNSASFKSPRSSGRNELTAPSMNEALFRCFLDFDKDFVQGGRNSSGSTACVVVWDARQCMLYVANTGDTRAVMSRSGNAIDLTFDRKASDFDEIARIMKQGGFVRNCRVSGALAVSRSLGDASLKNNPNSGLIADPDISVYRPSGLRREPDGSIERDEFIIVASDGLWDVMTSSEAVTMAREIMVSLGLLSINSCDDNSLNLDRDDRISAYQKVASALTSHAINVLNSQDNVTVMIIKIDIADVGADPSHGFDYENSQASTTSASFHSGDSKDYEMSDTAKEPFQVLDSLSTANLRANSREILSSKQMTITETSRSAPAKDDSNDDDLFEFLLNDKNFI